MKTATYIAIAIIAGLIGINAYLVARAATANVFLRVAGWHTETYDEENNILIINTNISHLKVTGSENFEIVNGKVK